MVTSVPLAGVTNAGHPGGDGQERDEIGEVLAEQRFDVVPSVNVLEGVGAFERIEERERVRAVAVRVGDDEAVPARPDVQRVELHLRRAVGLRRERQFLVAPVQKLAAVVRADAALHLLAHFGERAVGAEEPVGADALDGAVRLFDQHFARGGVDAGAAMFEVQRDVRILLRLVEEDLVQLVAVDGVQDFLAVLTVRLEALRAVDVVDDASFHRYGRRENAIAQTDFGQRGDAALGEAEVDGAAAFFHAVFARVGAAFVDVDACAVAREVQREQCAGQAAADDRHVLLILSGHRGHRAMIISTILTASSCSICAVTSAASAASKLLRLMELPRRRRYELMNSARSVGG